MAYTLIKGRFHIVGYSPDGDSIMFRADNPKHWQKLEGSNPELFQEKLEKTGGALQLRLQGIDALETHYSPPPMRTPSEVRGKETEKQSKPKAGNYHQPAEIGQMATDKFLNILGVKETKWRSWGKNTWIDRARILQKGEEVWVEDKHDDFVEGYIVTSAYEKNGRPLAWIFAGACDDQDGIDLDKHSLAARLKYSANYQLLKSGLVYPYFYMSLAGVLRKKMITATKLAMNSAKRKKAYLARKPEKAPKKVANLWFYDESATGIQIADLSQITGEIELYPYLFRKAVKTWYRQQMQQYWQAVIKQEAFEFDEDNKPLSIEELLDDGNPRVFVHSTQDFVRLSEILKLEGNTLTLTKNPMDLVFLS